MNSSIFPYLLILLLSVSIASFAQLLLKKEASREHSSFLSQYLNIPVLLAYFLLFIAAFCSLFAFRVLPLALSPLAEAFSQILIVTMSVVFLRENMTKRKLLGLAVIISGILLMIL